MPGAPVLRSQQYQQTIHRLRPMRQANRIAAAAITTITTLVDFRASAVVIISACSMGVCACATTTSSEILEIRV